MKCQFLLLFFIAASFRLPGQLIDSFDDPVNYVSTLVGSDSKYDISNGNTYPATATPWGMHFWTPQTEKAGESFIYNYQSDVIRGFKQTHQASNWIGDYGQFAVMPGVGKLRFHEEERGSLYSHKSETAQPHYYSVYLAEPGVTTEITTTDRAAILRFTFPASDSAYIVIDALDMGSFVRLDTMTNTLYGYSTKNKGSVPANFRNYFIIHFPKSFSFAAIFNGKKLLNGQLTQSADHVGAIVGFKTQRNERIEVKVASSFISEQQAQYNMKELGNAGFDEVRQRSKRAWNKELRRIKIGGATIDQARTFYSCLYRCLLFPRKFYETDSTGNIIHYSPFNGKIAPGYMFTDNGYFDTFRALFPLLSVLYPDLYSQILEGMVNAYKESGWLPEWTSPGHHAQVTFGSYSAAIISDAYLKGIRGYDIETLYQAIIKNTVNEPPKHIRSVGRLGVTYYNRLGYVPYDVGVKENTARTLEYAYLDFTIAQLARALHKPPAEIHVYEQRSFHYKKHFDPSTGLMRGRNADGTFQSPFNPFKWGDAFTEGNSWHYTWATVNDMQGLITLMGGKENFIKKLDSVFILPAIYDESWYGKVIHEIREMQLANMGQYVHGNQPMQHVVYLFNHAGAPWKTQYWVREILDKLYNPGPAGYCGDEDTGQTSAWYIFSALGFYPVTPGSNQYVFGAPLFRRAVVQLQNGKSLEITAPENDSRSRYIANLSINGKPHTKNWMSHEEMMNGAKIAVTMSAEPNLTRGGLPGDLPFSQSLPQHK
jgi:predicted alpha-1,2-mannosidase